MAFGNFDSERAAPLSEINMTPLVDVMLVLLVVFIVGMPLMQQSVRVELPKTASTQKAGANTRVTLAIDAAGQLWLDERAVGEAELSAELARLAADPALELELQADRAVRYEAVARTLAQAREAGISRIGFITTER
ncbi:ExbD/TolR family protein [Crenobacter caeni]|uniref:Biopolymer transporter ExbD n=1 Tax=Crenobacter caeni TaxID=2705474 RepID=A0A6B2KV93_9NEIS|nr:biopolymer transporter ExbD [Crenobacter caeni]NDV14166.1 biopolymer transporter ExbD [Crenobacter caeni]